MFLPHAVSGSGVDIQVLIKSLCVKCNGPASVVIGEGYGKPYCRITRFLPGLLDCRIGQLLHFLVRIIGVSFDGLDCPFCNVQLQFFLACFESRRSGVTCLLSLSSSVRCVYIYMRRLLSTADQLNDLVSLALRWVPNC